MGQTCKSQAIELSQLLPLEQGKSVNVSKFEIIDVLIRWSEVMSKMVFKDEVILEDETRTVMKRYTPIGVAAGIVPWNYPIALMTWKLIPALLTGNCIIIKSSPFTPLTTIRIIQEAQKHFPPGVLQRIVGDDKLGPLITEHPKIDKIGFTGSTSTGRAIAKSCAGTLKRMTLELGGNDASVVLPDVNVDEVAPQVMFAATLNSAQFCCASKRVYIHEDVYDRFTAAMVKASKTIEKAGHDFLVGGKVDDDQKGYFIPLTIVDNSSEDSRIVQEEPFGPIFPTLKDETELISRVNDSQWGLGASLWGNDDDAIDRISRKTEAGTVWCNTLQLSDPRVPFGGWKQSGYSHENGLEGLIAYCNVQILSLGHRKK